MGPGQLAGVGGGIEERCAADHAQAVEDAVNGVAAGPRRIAVGGPAGGGHPQEPGAEGGVVAVGQFCTEAHATDFLGQADAVQVDVIGVDQVVEAAVGQGDSAADSSWRKLYLDRK